MCTRCSQLAKLVQDNCRDAGIAPEQRAPNQRTWFVFLACCIRRRSSSCNHGGEQQAQDGSVSGPSVDSTQAAAWHRRPPQLRLMDRRGNIGGSERRGKTCAIWLEEEGAKFRATTSAPASGGEDGGATFICSCA